MEIIRDDHQKKEKEFLWHRKKKKTLKKERNECSLGGIIANALPLS